MNKRIYALIFSCFSSLIFATTASAAIEYDQDVTPDVIFGSGNANGSFTTDRVGEVEVGLRAKLRHDASGDPQNIFNSQGDGTYIFPAIVAPGQTFPTAVWSFEWSVNTDSADPVGMVLGDYTYELGLDTDPTAGTSFVTFDPISTTLAPCWDHSTGNNSTDSTTDTKRACPAEAAAYATDLTTNNVAQNSWKPHWFNGALDPRVEGTYNIYLEVFDGVVSVARTEIQVITQNVDPVSYDMPNGDTGTYNYWDKTYSGTGDNTIDCEPLVDGLGDLTDGVIADPDLPSQAGSDPWVGWSQAAPSPTCVDPTITFDFAGDTAFNSITLYLFDRDGGGGVGLPSSVDVTVGSNAPRNFPITNPAGISTLPVTLNLEGDVGDEVVVTLNHSTSWVFLTEVAFDGDVNPAANDDSATVLEDAAATVINVLGNDDNGDGGPMSIASATDPANGTVVVAGDGLSLTYQPDADYCDDGAPTDDFSYTLTPGGSMGTVSMTVTCVNDAPSFTASNPPTVNEDAPAQSGIEIGTGFSAGPANESGQSLMACVVTNVSGGGALSAGPTVTVDGDKCDLAYTPAADAFGVVTFDLAVQDSGGTSDGGVDTSATQQVTITILSVNDAPSFTAYDSNSDEDAGAQSGVVVGDSFSPGPANESSQALMACKVSNLSVPAWLLSSGPTVTIGGTNSDECHLAYTAAPDANGSFTFDLAVMDDGGTANGGVDTSATQEVTITVNPVNDPPTVTSVTELSQTIDYSDYIETVTIVVKDIDDASTGLAESNEPPASAAGLSLSTAAPPCVTDASFSPNPAENGSTCTWTYDGQVIDPGDNVYAIVFTPSDGDGDGTVTGTHTLTIQPEDADVMLDGGNPVAVPVTAPDGDSVFFTMMFSAWETTNPEDFPHDGTAEFGDLNNMVPFMTLIPVGPGGPVDADSCAFTTPLPVYPGEGYSQVALFECEFDMVPVNTYEVVAAVDGADGVTRYYTGSDDDVLVVFDPSLGFTTGGGWFYWPGTADPGLDTCGVDGYPGDKTNFGYNMKYNKKRTNIQGQLLVMRHTVDSDCLDAGSYKVKSNALDGLAVGEGTDSEGDYGWAAISGKSTFREPGLEGDGNHPFLMYVEDHGEQGCNQFPSDEFWIEVKDKDEVVILEVNGPDSDPAGVDSATDGDDEPINCGNIYVPHSATGGGGGGGGGGGKPPKPPKGPKN